MREKIERIVNYYKFGNNIKRTGFKNKWNFVTMQMKSIVNISHKIILLFFFAFYYFFFYVILIIEITKVLLLQIILGIKNYSLHKKKIKILQIKILKNSPFKKIFKNL